MPFPPKKEKGVGVMIAIGKPKSDGPPPLDSPGERPAPKQAAHEAAEDPATEGTEQGGVDMMSDLDALSEQYGLDATSGRSFVKAALAAMAKCMGGDEQESSGADEGAEPSEYEGESRY